MGPPRVTAKGPVSILVDTYAVVPTPSRDGTLVIDRHSRTSQGRNFFRTLQIDGFLRLDPAARWVSTAATRERHGWSELSRYLEGLRRPSCSVLGEVHACDNIVAALDAFIEEVGPLGAEAGPHAIASPRDWVTYLQRLAAPLRGTVDGARAVAGVRGVMRHQLVARLRSLEAGTDERSDPLTLNALLRLASLAALWAKGDRHHRSDPVMLRLVARLDRVIEARLHDDSGLTID